MVVSLTNGQRYLAQPITRATHGPKLYWFDGPTTTGPDRGGNTVGGATKRYITLDVIPKLDHTESSTVTEFPVQDGTYYADHIIHLPDTLTLEIVQTNEPFEDVDEDGFVIDFPFDALPLSVPRTNFRPKGLLALSLMGEAGAAEVLNEIGIGGPTYTRGPDRIALQKPPNPRDRVNELLDALSRARTEGFLLNLDWLGRVWSNLAIENITYTRQAGKMAGYFAVTLKKVHTTSTEVTVLPTPAELRLKPKVNGGQKQPKTPSPAEKKVVEKTMESGLHVIARKATGG